MAKEIHWADLAAENLIKIKNKKKYTCASGITPSGVVHIGNFREIITTALVAQALKDKGKEVRFIYSWDDYDVFRKVPENMPKKEILKEYLGKPIVDVPDTYGCHKSYAIHNEKEFEKNLPNIGINVEFIYQNEMYRKSKYAEEIKKALNSREIIKEILNKYREEPLPESWYPLSVFCDKCKDDNTEVLDYDENYLVIYKCNKCGLKESFDLRKKGIAKLPWRVDWPMRWYYEDVDFEPGGKDHSVVGGSFTTAKDIVKMVWNKNAPYYTMYDFVSIKGRGGKMSKSAGNIITLNEILEIYPPEMTRWIFASTRPNTELTISFDLDVINLYEEFDKCERIYFGKQKIDEALLEKEKRIYELSCMDIPKKMLLQLPFRHLTNILQVNELNVNKTLLYLEIKKEDEKRIKERIICAKNWLEKYAPEEFKFKINENPSKVSLKEKEIVKEVITILEKSKLDDETLHKEFYEIAQKLKIEVKDFFKIMYKILINKERGPKLANFMLTIGQKRVIILLKKAI